MHNIIHIYKFEFLSTSPIIIIIICRVHVFQARLGQAPWIDGIWARRTHYNEFVESGSKSWARMRQWLMWQVEMIEQELRTQGRTSSQFEGTSSSLDGMNSHLVWFTRGMKEEPGPLPSPSEPPFLWEISYLIWFLLWSILILHLLVILTHTCVHVPSATPFDIL